MFFQRFLFAFFVSVLMIISACTSQEERVNKYFADGLQLIEQENFTKAALAFKNVLQIRPKYAEARYQLGLAEEKQENWRAAFGHYREAVELNETLIPPRIRLAELYLLAKRRDNTSELVNEVLAINPNHPGGLALRGRLFSLDGDIDKATLDAEKAVSIAPAHVGAVTLLSSLRIQQGNNDEGIAILEKGVSLNPSDITLKLILSKKYSVVELYDKSEALLQQLIDNEPTVALHRVRMADFQTSVKKLDEAELTLRDAINDNPDNANLKLVLADFLEKRRGDETAEETLQQFIVASPQEYKLRFGLANLYSRQQEREKLISVYESIIELDTNTPAKLKAKSQLASIYLAEEKYEAALRLIEEVLLENPNDQQALFNRGALFLKKEAIPSAIADFRTLLKNQPNSVIALRSLAKAHAINNELDLAKDYFQKAIVIEDGNADLHFELAKVLALLKDKPSALESVNRSLKLNPNALEALQVKAKILMSQKDWPKASGIATEVKQTHPGSSLGFYLQGLIYAGEQKYALAAKQYKKALLIVKDDVRTLGALLKVRFVTKTYSVALKDVEQFLKNNPLNYMALIYLGEVYLAQNKIDLAEASFIRAKDHNPETADAYRNLARIYLFQKQAQKAVELLESGTRNSGKNLGLMLDLAGLHESSDNAQEAVKMYEAILEKRPGVFQAANNLAMLMIKQGQPENLKRAKELIKTIESVQNPFYKDTVGWVKFNTGDIEGALQYIQIAIKAVPDNAEINYHLGMVYQKRGNTALAKKHLEAAISLPQEFAGKEEAKQVLATL